MEFINSAPCPISINRESFFRVDLDYGEVFHCFTVFFFLAQETKEIRAQDCIVFVEDNLVEFESISDSFFAFGDP